MPTNEELLRKSYSAATGNAQQDTSSGVYQWNKMRRDPFAQANGSTGAANGTGSISTLPGDFPVGNGRPSAPGQGNSGNQIPDEWLKPAGGRPPNTGAGTGSGEYPNKRPPSDSALDPGFGWPGRPSAPGQGTYKPGTQPPGTPPGTDQTNPGSATPGTGETTPGTGETTPGTSDAAGTTDATNKTASSGNKSVLEWYREYLNKLGGYETPSAKDQSDMVKDMYDANLASNKAQLESNYNQSLSDLESEASTIGSTYYEQQRQAQAESDRNRQAFQEYANARGLNSGTGGQAELARSNQLSANLNALRQSEAEKRAEVERQRVLLGQQYQNAIQKAQADNDLARAKALYEEAVRVDESISAAAKADADRALQMFNILNNTALSAANAYASQDNPDLSLYAQLLGTGSFSGGSSSELNELYDKAKQIMSTGGYYSGGGGGYSSSSSSTFKKATSEETEWAEYYINLINSAGGIDNVQDYLAMNYKSYGIPYQTVSRTTASMAEKAKGYSTNKYKIGSEKGKDIANSLGTGNTYQASDGSVWRKSSNGKIYVTKDGVEMEAQIV